MYRRAQASLRRMRDEMFRISGAKLGNSSRDFPSFTRNDMRDGKVHPSDLVMTRKAEDRTLYLTQFEDANELSTFFEKTSHRARAFVRVVKRVGIDGRNDWMYGDYEDKDAREIDKVLEKIDSGIAVGDVLSYMDEKRDELELSGALDLSNSTKNCKRTRRFTDESGELDIDRVLSGDENYWMENKRDGKQEFLRIVINLSLSCGNGADVHAELLASGLVTAEILEKMGYGIEIYVGYFGHENMRDSNERGWMLKLKDCTEHMDEQRIASVGCSLVQRVISFSMMTYFYDFINHYCIESSDEMIDFMGADIYIGRQWTEGEQTEMIRKAVLKIAEGR